MNTDSSAILDDFDTQSPSPEPSEYDLLKKTLGWFLLNLIPICIRINDWRNSCIEYQRMARENDPMLQLFTGPLFGETGLDFLIALIAILGGLTGIIGFFQFYGRVKSFKEWMLLFNPVLLYFVYYFIWEMFSRYCI